MRPIPVRQLSPDPLAQVLKLLTQAHGRRSGVLEGPRGHGQAAEIILEARLGSGQVCVGAGRLPAEHDRHQQRLMPGGHRLIPDTDDVAFGSTTAVAPFCRIEATARPTSDSQIAFEVWLPPLVAWNNRFQAVGSGSSAGSIATTAMTAPLADGYAVMAQNNGHVTDTSRPNGAAEQTWALGHP